MQLRPVFWLILFAFFAACVAIAPTHAAGAIVGEPVSTCIAKAQPGMTASRILTRPTEFRCTRPQAQLGPGDFWVVSGPVPASVTGGVPLGVRIASLWQDAVTLYALYPDGSIVSRRMDDAGATRAVQLGAILQQALPYHTSAPVRLAWHVEGAANMRGVLLAPHIATPRQIAKANVAMAALYSALMGLAVALLVHNFAIWRVLRQRFQLWYVTMLACGIGYMFCASGALAWAWPDILNTQRLRLNYIALAMTGVAAIRFSRWFFEDRIFTDWLSRWVDVASVMLLAITAVYVVAAPWQLVLLDRLYNLAFLALLLAVVPIMWRAWRLKSEYFWLFVATWIVPLALGGMRIVHNFGLLGWNFWIDNSTLLSMAGESLGASLAIAYRVRQLARERDAARAEELIARMLADADPLTGLLNRRAFLTQAVGRQGDQALWILDLDRFKSVNDTIGHDGGDEVLRLVAQVLRSMCPENGLVTRLGGEEFALLCPIGEGVAADALLARVRETRMPYDLKVTASIGGCIGPLANERDWKALYRNADQALFAAKRAGRDRARITTASTALAA